MSKAHFNILMAFVIGVYISVTIQTQLQISVVRAQHAGIPSPPRMLTAHNNSSLSAPRQQTPTNRTVETNHEDATSKSSLYGQYCNDTVIGEKQTWSTHKKIISYSVFAPPGTDVPQWIIDGITIQAKTAMQYYPDWVIRLYAVDLSPKYEQEIVTTYENVELVRCSRREGEARMMMHRFLVVDDPTVLYSLVRDIDSRFTLRELMAVNEFIASGELFHSMRDHNLHSIQVMGGAFGMKRGLLGQHKTTMTDLMEKFIESSKVRIAPKLLEDQIFLAKSVWPLVRQDTICHDMNLARCRRYSSKICRDFPLGPRNQDEGYYVGAPFKSTPDEPDDKFSSTVVGHTCSLHCEIPS